MSRSLSITKRATVSLQVRLSADAVTEFVRYNLTSLADANLSRWLQLCIGNVVHQYYR